MRIFVRKRDELYRVYIGSELQSKHISKESAMASAKYWKTVAKSTGETWDLVDKVEMIKRVC